MNNTDIIKKVGSLCSKEGKNYEIIIYNIVKNCTINGKSFNTQNISELGGCSSINDIECNLHIDKDIPIEIKKCKTPDWMQCSLKYDNVLEKWIGSNKNKIPLKSKQILENLIENYTLFNGNIPPFINNNITYPEWKNIKKYTTDYNDMYFDCPNTTIRDLYRAKNCYYIQISNKGLYHLGEDICEFNVPEFICEQRLRIRIKIHTTKNSKGFCSLSVTISPQPVNIKLLENSLYSLDDIKKLPINLIYNI
jgi:hypothetical protein